jgi:hypothetical protein
MKDYGNLKTNMLVDKGVELIKDEHMELINELKKEKAIEPRQSGVFHPYNTIGNFINDQL